MSAIAIIKTGGKQYKVKEGDKVSLEKFEVKDGKITFKEVLFWSDGQEIKVGTPLVAKVRVEGKLLEQRKDKKVFGVKQKAKKRQLKKFGHRQEKNIVEIEKIIVA